MHTYSLNIHLCSYKHAIDGMARVYREEGLKNLFSGADWATGRWLTDKDIFVDIL